jgi:hypothetical protein
MRGEHRERSRDSVDHPPVTCAHHPDDTTALRFASKQGEWVVVVTRRMRRRHVAYQRTAGGRHVLACPMKRPATEERAPGTINRIVK